MPALKREDRVIRAIIKEHGTNIDLARNPGLFIELVRKYAFDLAHVFDGPDGGTPPRPDAGTPPLPGGVPPAPTPPSPEPSPPGPTSLQFRPQIEDLMREIMKIQRKIAEISRKIG